MKLLWIGRLCPRILQKNHRGDGSTGVRWNRTTNLLSKYRVVALGNMGNDSVRTILVTPEIDSFQTQFLILYLYIVVVLPVNLTPITLLDRNFWPSTVLQIDYTALPYLQSKHTVNRSSYLLYQTIEQYEKCKPMRHRTSLERR